MPAIGKGLPSEIAGKAVKLLKSFPLIRPFRVQGESMLPTLHEGDLIWVRVGHQARPQPGDVVVLKHPTNRDLILVKRVRSCSNKTFSVGGDNPAFSRDSRHFGSVPYERFIGRVLRVGT